MALVKELRVGETYERWGARCRIDAISPDPSGTGFVIEIATGRSFERAERIETRHRFHYDQVAEIERTWAEHKAHQAARKNDRQLADQLNDRLQPLVKTLGLGWLWIDADGKLEGRGDLRSLADLVAKLELLADEQQATPTASAVGELLG